MYISLTWSYEFDGVSNPDEQCSFVTLFGKEMLRRSMGVKLILAPLLSDDI